MEIFETASFHIVKPCNMKCKFCYATFEDMHVGPQMALEVAKDILDKLKASGLQKITFAGGEPMLYKHLDAAIEYSKEIGLTTSIITNGSLITRDILDSWKGKLDWIGVSIDTVNPFANNRIGRETRMLQNMKYQELIYKIQVRGFKLKINTVVNAYNHHENMLRFINYADPLRWKVFQALRIEGQNDSQFDEIKVTDEQFKDYLERNAHPSMVPENNDVMTGSYLLIDPLGRLFENSAGKHTYSDPLQSNTFEHCLAQINPNKDKFIARGGIYKW